MEKVRFLIIRFSSIGDIVLTTPVVRNLKMQVEGAEIHYLTKKKFASLVHHNPYVDYVHEYEGDYIKLEQQLKSIEFDYVIDLHRNLRSFRVKRSLKKVSFTFDKLNIKKWLYVTFKIQRMPNIHIVERYMATLSLFDVENDNKGLDYFINSDSISPELPESHRGGYLVAVLGANHFTKQIPEQLMVKLLNQSGFPVVLLGGDNEQKIAERVVEQLSVPVWNVCGDTSLDGSADLIRNCRVVLTPDTGMMHIAAAFNKPIVSVWGNTTPLLGMYPYMPENEHGFFMAQVNDLKCRPCSKIGFEKCPKKHFKCMENQDYKEIVNKIKMFWETNER